jgi:hypothetical protein
MNLKWSPTMHLLRQTAVVALLLSTTIAGAALAANPSSTGCPPGTQKTEGEGGSAALAARGTQKTEGEGGSAALAARGTQKTEGEGGSAALAARGTQKTEGEGGSQALASRGLQKTEGEGGKLTQQAAATPCR